MKYHISDDAVIVTVCGEHLLFKVTKVPSGSCRIRQVNSEAAVIFGFMKEEPDREAVIRKTIEKYGIDRDTAERAHDGFLDGLIKEGVAIPEIAADGKESAL